MKEENAISIPKSETIFLIGFMGAGKTTLGKEIAAQRKLQFIDLDVVIEKQEGKNIATLVTEKGIDYFRKIESELLKTLELENSIVSTGGGTPCFFDNLNWMKLNGKVIFINPTFDVIFSRLKESDISKRPLLNNMEPSEWKEKLQLLYFDRLPFYEQASIFFDPIKQKLTDLFEDY